MSEAPNPWDLILTRMDRLEAKVDRVGERVVSRDEFERYKQDEEKRRIVLLADLKEQETKLDTHKENLDERKRLEITREQDEKAKWRLFWAGVLLSPVAGAAVAWIVTGVLT